MFNVQRLDDTPAAAASHKPMHSAGAQTCYGLPGKCPAMGNDEVFFSPVVSHVVGFGTEISKELVFSKSHSFVEYLVCVVTVKYILTYTQRLLYI